MGEGAGVDYSVLVKQCFECLGNGRSRTVLFCSLLFRASFLVTEMELPCETKPYLFVAQAKSTSEGASDRS